MELSAKSNHYWADKSAEDWITENKGKSYFNERSLSVANSIELHDDMSIIDLGCGTGAFVCEVVSRAAKQGVKIHIVGVDHTPGMLDRARG